MKVMDCLECKDLDRALKLTIASYMTARSAAFYRVCTDIAAKKEVDMERAKTALQEHRLVCPLAIRTELADHAGDFCAPVAPASKPD
ncbi:MAG: hypothetical protein LAO06_14925 [Acidobacteriia bacterium]|nr:hypothetical protein [Terriglobia bacterium]